MHSEALIRMSIWFSKNSLRPGAAQFGRCHHGVLFGPVFARTRHTLRRSSLFSAGQSVYKDLGDVGEVPDSLQKEVQKLAIKRTSRGARCCEFEDCKKRATFNLPGLRPPTRCGEHKAEGMVDVYSLVCEVEGCVQLARCRFPEQKGYRRCKEHMLEGMLHFGCKIICQEEDCKKLACYNFPGMKPGVRCGEHKLEKMVAISSPICEHEECLKYASFNFMGNTKKPIRCKTHKLDGMVNVTYRPKTPRG